MIDKEEWKVKFNSDSCKYRIRNNKRWWCNYKYPYEEHLCNYENCPIKIVKERPDEVIVYCVDCKKYHNISECQDHEFFMYHFSDGILVRLKNKEQEKNENE